MKNNKSDHMLEDNLRERKDTVKDDAVLNIESLSINYSTNRGTLHAVRDVTFNINRGESFGLVGESGSGKSTIALAIFNYLDENGMITEGEIKFKNNSITDLTTSQLQQIRGNEIAHIAQDPRKSLNPSIQIGEQISEVVNKHTNKSKKQVKEKVISLLKEVNISDPKFNYSKYPHELSGGMQQRVLIAMAIACDPDLIVMDEPTSGLDVTTEAKILDLIEELKNKSDTSILIITHNMGVVSETTDRVGVLYAGELMEIGPTEDIFSSPANPYTKGLLQAVPAQSGDSQLSPITGQIPDLTNIEEGCIFAERCEFAEEECKNKYIENYDVTGGLTHKSKCRRWEEISSEQDTKEIKNRSDIAKATTNNNKYDGNIVLEVNKIKKYYSNNSLYDKIFRSKKPVKAVDGVSFEIQRGETFGLVGESGCGKSTLARSILGLVKPTSGGIRFQGENILIPAKKPATKIKDCSIVFQNPDSSLNPEKSVYRIIARPIELNRDLNKDEINSRVGELLDQVQLGPEYASRYPSQLSGGEKQRVAIARAFATNPSLVILDEPVSALDVSVQASILNLLDELKKKYNTSYLFIGHDLGVIRYICDRVAVMYLGEFVETGTTGQVFSPPHHPYTKSLVSNIPSVDTTASADRIQLDGTVPSAREPPSGCSFHTRCPYKIGEECEKENPELSKINDQSGDHHISCHLDVKDMKNLE